MIFPLLIDAFLCECVCLSKGALAMSRKKVIVKQFGAIQNFGAMDVLCTDKTGTLTMDQVILERYCDVMQKVCRQVGLNADDILFGSKVENDDRRRTRRRRGEHARFRAPLARA